MSRKRLVSSLLFALALCTAWSIAAAASAQSFDANLDSFQEVMPHNTPGYGSADATFNNVTDILTITAGTGLYADLLAGATTVRLQDGAVGMNGPTISLLNLDTPGNTSGTFSGSTTAITGAQLTDLLNGNTYLNITDSVFPSGEIRGQLLVTPEPPSCMLLGMGAACLFAVARRGRRRA
jgi:hypothetical protein